MAKLEPPMLTLGPLSGEIFVVTYGRVTDHPTVPDATMVIASTKYNVTDQFNDLFDQALTQIIETAQRENARTVVDAGKVVLDVAQKARKSG